MAPATKGNNRIKRKMISRTKGALAKGAAKAGKDASNGVEEKIAELEGKLAQAEHEKQIASTAAVMSAKGLVFSGDKSDVNIAFLYVPKKKEGTAVAVALP